MQPFKMISFNDLLQCVEYKQFLYIDLKASDFYHNSEHSYNPHYVLGTVLSILYVWNAFNLTLTL